MKATNTYLYFDGNCREAMTFYEKCLESKAHFTTYREGPPELAEAAKTVPERILHAELANGPVVLMASDALPGPEWQRGSNFAISVSCESREELERVFAHLSENGTVQMAVHLAFWGGYMGVVRDRFGVSWMLSFRETGGEGSDDGSGTP